MIPGEMSNKELVSLFGKLSREYGLLVQAEEVLNHQSVNSLIEKTLKLQEEILDRMTKK